MYFVIGGVNIVNIYSVILKKKFNNILVRFIKVVFFLFKSGFRDWVMNKGVLGSLSVGSVLFVVSGFDVGRFFVFCESLFFS